MMGVNLIIHRAGLRFGFSLDKLGAGTIIFIISLHLRHMYDKSASGLDLVMGQIHKCCSLLIWYLFGIKLRSSPQVLTFVIKFQCLNVQC